MIERLTERAEKVRPFQTQQTAGTGQGPKLGTFQEGREQEQPAPGSFSREWEIGAGLQEEL